MSECVILAIDPGAKSGWCVTSAGAAVSGVAESIAARSMAIEIACRVSTEAQLPLVIVAESWSRHGRWSHSAQAGTSAEWGKWLASIEGAGLDAMPKLGRWNAYRGVVRVDSTTWHVALGGSRRNPRAVRLRMAMARARTEDPDEACARCIGEWARHAAEVRKVLPAAFRRAT